MDIFLRCNIKPFFAHSVEGLEIDWLLEGWALEFLIFSLDLKDWALNSILKISHGWKMKSNFQHNFSEV